MSLLFSWKLRPGGNLNVLQCCLLLITVTTKQHLARHRGHMDDSPDSVPAFIPFLGRHCPVSISVQSVSRRAHQGKVTRTPQYEDNILSLLQNKDTPQDEKYSSDASES